MDFPTKTVHITPEEIPYYHLKEPIQNILDSDDFKNNISDSERIECIQCILSFNILSFVESCCKIKSI